MSDDTDATKTDLVAVGGGGGGGRFGGGGLGYVEKPK